MVGAMTDLEAPGRCNLASLMYFAELLSFAL